MIIHNIRINNFKSLYGEHYFDFDKCKGLIKLSGPIGSGKTSLAEAIIWGLFGTIKGQTNTSIISWNEKTCEIELNITSKNKEINIVRNIKEPLMIKVNDKLLNASNKRDTQSILEEELLDIPKLAIIKMCIISFTQFNSLANMNPGETKQFLDDIFGFKLFTEYQEQAIIERKSKINDQLRFNSIYEDNLNQIENLKKKQESQTTQLSESVNVDALNEKRANLVQQGVNLKDKRNNLINERSNKDKEYDLKIKDIQNKMTEAITLGKQAKNHYNTFKTGICPTCGQKIDQSNIDEYKTKMNEYAKIYRDNESIKINLEQEKKEKHESYNQPIADCDTQMDLLRKQISKIDAELKSYNDSVHLIQENFEDLIHEYEAKAQKIKDELDKCDIEIGEWNEIIELFTKTLRYSLIENLIPHINKSIQYFINKLNQPFNVKYDQEFKAHIFVDSWDREIAYNNLSTGQKKTLDLAIIFGVLQNIVSSIDMNIIFLDELFSNMDADTRNTMLNLLNETMVKDKSIFVVNHAEMADDLFTHKIRVSLENKKITHVNKNKEEETLIIKCSKYEQIL